jgi:acyl-CoA synthetase (AMP-forming)/AMP-acid ligase II
MSPSSGIADPTLGQRVGAVVELAGDSAPSAACDILAYARRQLADYKVPERLEVVSQISRTTLGKVDRASVLALISDGHMASNVS